MRSLILLASAALVACGASGIVRPADEAPPANYACSNDPMHPAGAFQVIYSRDGKSVDTTAVTANRYLEPHRSADTVRTVTNQGALLLFIFSGKGGDRYFCMTLYDSLTHHLPNARGAIFVP